MSVLGPRLPSWAADQVGSYLRHTGRAANVVATAAFDPTPTTWAVQQVVGYLRCSGRDADLVVTAAHDPNLTLAQRMSCKCQPHNSSTLAAIYSITSSARSKIDCGTVRPCGLPQRSSKRLFGTSTARIFCRLMSRNWASDTAKTRYRYQVTGPASAGLFYSWFPRTSQRRIMGSRPPRNPRFIGITCNVSRYRRCLEINT